MRVDSHFTSGGLPIRVIRWAHIPSVITDCAMPGYGDMTSSHTEPVREGCKRNLRLYSSKGVTELKIGFTALLSCVGILVGSTVNGVLPTTRFLQSMGRRKAIIHMMSD